MTNAIRVLLIVCVSSLLLFPSGANAHGIMIGPCQTTDPDLEIQADVQGNHVHLCVRYPLGS